jgi:urate oxidase
MGFRAGGSLMSSFLLENSYGKSAVRLTKVIRHADRHVLKELTASIQLQGDFARSYTEGDNSAIVATDTMKNTVYVLAAKHPIDTIENFAKVVGEHFLSLYPQVEAASIEICEDLWERIVTKGKPHQHSFVGGQSEKRVAHVDCVRGSTIVESGIEDLMVLKTTDSEFHGFVRDEYTTLPDVKDRIFATDIVVHWLYKKPEVDFDKIHATVRQLILDVFAEHHSLAVQQTLYAMGDRVLETCSDIDEIRISMPNKHRILFDLSRFGLPNNHEIFVNSIEPFGLISATMGRTAAATRMSSTAELSSKA